MFLFSVLIIPYFCALRRQNLCFPPFCAFAHTAFSTSFPIYPVFYALFFIFSKLCAIFCVFHRMCALYDIYNYTHQTLWPSLFPAYLFCISRFIRILRAFYPLILTFFHLNDFHTGKLHVDTFVPARYNKHINSTEHTIAQCWERDPEKKNEKRKGDTLWKRDC